MNPYVEAARPKTLSAAVAPVLVGTAAASVLVLWRALAALVVALALQVAVNYANDYFDAAAGVDTADRIGPRRAVAAGLIAPERMRRAIVAALLVAGLAGFALTLVVGAELVWIGVLAVPAVLGYSGGRRPYASAGLGEVSVFAFFGPIATVGSTYVHDQRIVAAAVAASVPVGLLAVAILVANNLRDIPTDRAAGKRTLAVRLGDARTRQLFAVLFVLAFGLLGVVAAAAGSWWPLLAAGAVPLAARPVRLAVRGAAGGALVAVLVGTARTQLGFALLLATGLALA